MIKNDDNTERGRKSNEKRRKRKEKKKANPGEKISPKEEKPKGKRKGKKGSGSDERAGWLRQAGSMPTNYECKVMVILISSAKKWP